MAGNWCTIESDPGVFSELLSSIGVKDVGCEEIWSLEDQDSVDNLRPIYGLVFLFKYKTNDKPVDRSTQAPHIYFAKQVIPNACGTQAIINILLNITDKVDIGPQLQSFLEFTADMDPENKGITIGSFDTIRDCHNSFARHQNFTFEESQATDDDDVYHFIGYVPKDGVVYELDGLQNGPIEVGSYSDDWLQVANGAIQERMASYNAGELGFTLLALCKNPLEEMKIELAELEAAGAGGDPHCIHLQSRIEQLEEKRKRWQTENVRRRHNYIPFLFHLLKKLSEHGELKTLAENAASKTKEEGERAKAKKEAKKAS